MELREQVASILTKERFSLEEWEWYQENKSNLNVKAQLRWDSSCQYGLDLADDIIPIIEKAVKERIYDWIVEQNDFDDIDQQTYYVLNKAVLLEALKQPSKPL